MKWLSGSSRNSLRAPAPLFGNSLFLSLSVVEWVSEWVREREKTIRPGVFYYMKFHHAELGKMLIVVLTKPNINGTKPTRCAQHKSRSAKKQTPTILLGWRVICVSLRPNTFRSHIYSHSPPSTLSSNAESCCGFFPALSFARQVARRQMRLISHQI